MKWIKKGQIISPESEIIPAWGKKRLMLPTPLIVNNNTIRIFAGFCDHDDVGRIGYIDVDLKNPATIRNISTLPVLDVGDSGMFDDNGVVPTSILHDNSSVSLYYAGYQLGTKIKYFIFDGLAKGKVESNTFDRVSLTPVIDRRGNDAFFRTGSFVMKDEGKWKMWYIGGGSWIEKSQKKIPVYTCKYIESENGRDWYDEPVVCLDFQNDDEHGFSRPWIIKDKGIYKMFYSIRTITHGYLPGYAESDDGIKWKRLDRQAGITLSDEGWDSQMFCYPAVVSAGGDTYLFYNGNGFGETGIGYAVLH